MALCLLFCCHCAVARNSLALSGFVMSVCLAISRSLSCTVFSVDGFLPFKRISSMYWFIAESVVSGIFWYDVRCTGITSLTCQTPTGIMYPGRASRKTIAVACLRSFTSCSHTARRAE